MAVRYATKTGNWSDVTVWDGGTTLPGAGDDVYSNTFIVTIDQTITVTSLNNGATTGVTQGGYFIARNGNTINANINHGNTSTNSYCLSTTGMSNGEAITINGNLTNVVSAGNTAYGVLYAVASGVTITINGNVTAAVASSAGHGITVGTGTNNVVLNINGNIYGGNRGNTVYANSAGIALGASSVNLTINVVGNIYGGGGAAPTSYVGSHGIYILNATGTINITITGNVYAGNATVSALSHGILLSGTPNATVVHSGGNLYGPKGTTGASALALSGTQTNSTVSVTGDLIGSTTSTSSQYVLICDTVLSTVFTGNITCNLGAGINARNLTLNSTTITGSTTVANWSVVFHGLSNNITVTTFNAIGGGAFSTGSANVSATVVVTNPLAPTTGTGIMLQAINSNNTINFTGTVDERNNNTTQASAGAIVVNGGATINFTGDIYAGLRNGVWIGGQGTTNATTLGTFNLLAGTITAGVYNTGANYCCGIATASASAGNKATINVYGRLVATEGSINHGLYINSTITLAHQIFIQTIVSNGYPVTSTYANYGINNASLTAIWAPVIVSMEYGSAGLPPSYTGRVFFQENLANYVQGRDSSGVVVLMGDVAQDYPAVSNVRLGTAYNFGSQIGTCNVPVPANVTLNVPVDHTVGTAVLTAEALWALPTSDMTTPGSIGERLKNSSTVDTVAAQLTALL